MQKKSSWLKFYRKTINSKVFDNEKCLKIWIWCLCRVAYKDQTIFWNEKEIKIKRGQFIMGGFTAEKKLKLARSTIRYWLDFLEKEGMITVQNTNKYTIVTIKNWDEYQGENFEEEETERDIAREIWIKTYGKNPTLIQRDFINEVLEKFGEEKATNIFRTFAENNFRKISTMKECLSETGEVILNKGNNSGGGLILYTYEEHLNLCNKGQRGGAKYDYKDFDVVFDPNTVNNPQQKWCLKKDIKKFGLTLWKDFIKGK